MRLKPSLTNRWVNETQLVVVRETQIAIVDVVSQGVVWERNAARGASVCVRNPQPSSVSFPHSFPSILSTLVRAWRASDPRQHLDGSWNSIGGAAHGGGQD